MSMEKGKWHRVNGKLVRRRKNHVDEHENGSNGFKTAVPVIKSRRDRETERMVDSWWSALSVHEKLEKALYVH